jgi:hypothetical protein
MINLEEYITDYLSDNHLKFPNLISECNFIEDVKDEVNEIIDKIIEKTLVKTLEKQGLTRDELELEFEQHQELLKDIWGI